MNKKDREKLKVFDLKFSKEKPFNSNRDVKKNKR